MLPDINEYNILLRGTKYIYKTHAIAKEENSK
jgi:hypothetical protein